ncbi:crossover junction endodeoxyribonuclease RuvC [Candidatus Kaiserbacteria bacterium]|nr:crossover junction endodeoxyribonuclease RuvC [Candidatus Kaiserbacteria bacterium]
MRVLAIDPGYGRCGVAVVEKEDGKERLLYSACTETPASSEFPERLAVVVAACTELLEKYSPDALALEKLYVTRNQKTAMRVSEVRGALIAAATQRHVPVFEYTPSEVKAAVSGFGAADKRAVIKMLHALVKIERQIKHDDEYDAIAIAVTYLSQARR